MNTSRTAALRALGRAAVSGLLVVLLFVSALAAGNVSLHHWFHSDQQSPTHECFITTLAKGHTDISAPSSVIFVPLSVAFAEPSAPLEARGARTHLLPDPRGPPVLS